MFELPDVDCMYKLYFGCPLGDQDKSWATHVICTSCLSGLRDWLNKRKLSMSFAIPMVWREQKNHYDDCYFCLIDITEFLSKNKHIIALFTQTWNLLADQFHTTSPYQSQFLCHS